MLKQSHRWFAAFILVWLIVSMWIGWHFLSINSSPQPSSTLFAPKTLKELIAMSAPDLEKCDLGLMNLLCAEGLPGAENLAVHDCMTKLDSLADYVKTETQRHEYRFREHPERFNNSEAYFRMNMLGSILVQDLGIQYNPGIALPQLDGQTPTMAAAADSRDLFLHGLLSEKPYGTCASMPVLYVAIARRLGYSVNLAATKYHYYVRCEDGKGKHFNVEATSAQGFFTPSDAEYQNGRFPCTQSEIEQYGWLRPLTTQEILGNFLNLRSICLGNAKRYSEAKEVALLAVKYFPKSELRRASVEKYLQQLSQAPLGDKIIDWRRQLSDWEIPQGPRYAYFENRKIQLRYFVGLCPDANASEQAVADLQSELSRYVRQININTNSLKNGQSILQLFDKAGHEIRLPANALPPPLNRGEFQEHYLRSLQHINYQDEAGLMDALWKHYQEITLDWSNQPALLFEN